MPTTSITFGELLRQFRRAAALTQEALADRAGLSVHGIQKLERGATHPYRDTVNRLEVALRLPTDESVRFRAAAQPARRQPGLANDTRRHNLPIPTTTFVPRAGEIERVIHRLHEARLLTITGSGGCGKTRLATEVADQLAGDFPDGVWLVDLARLTDSALVPQTIATTIGLRQAPAGPPLGALSDYLRNICMLLVLDNCEHIIDAAAQVADGLLRTCAKVKIIATSRELLAVDGEMVWRVGPLSMAAPWDLGQRGDDLTQAVLGSESGRLFADRAALVVPSFEITDRNAGAVAQVCQRLDGIPLAIELAAARLITLNLDQIASRLDQRFHLLTSGRRTAAQRQQTLEATIDWSYELLSKAEQDLLRRLAVFHGSWSLEAAEAVAADVGTGEQGVYELLSNLVVKSMVGVEESPDGIDEVRYRFLETIRQYAEQKLLMAGEADRLRLLHRDWYLELTERAFDGYDGPAQKTWWRRLELEHENMRAALAWSASDANSSQQLLVLAARMARFAQWQGYLREGIDWLEIALARAEPRPSTERGWALNWRGQLEVISGNGPAGRPYLERSIADARAVGDRRLLSIALRHFGATGPREAARAVLEEAVAVSRSGGWLSEIAWNMSVLGRTLALAGEVEAAEERLQEGLLIARRSGDMMAVIMCLGNLGLAYARHGDIKRARQVLMEATDLGAEVGVKFMAALPRMTALTDLGDVCMIEQDWEAAEGAYRTALEEATRGTTRSMMAYTARRYAALRQARGDHARAVRLLAPCAPISRAWDSTIFFDPIASEERILEAARSALGDDEFARAMAAGQALTLEEAIAEVLRPGSTC